MKLLSEIAVVALGGALGATCRFGVSQLGFLDSNKYYYTMVINLTGCLLMGVLWGLLSRQQANQLWFLFLLTGCLGGYTTYSAFTLDAIQLIQRSMWLELAKYVGITFVGGFSCCGLGLWLTNKILG